VCKELIRCGDVDKVSKEVLSDDGLIDDSLIDIEFDDHNDYINVKKTVSMAEDEEEYMPSKIGSSCVFFSTVFLPTSKIIIHDSGLNQNPDRTLHTAKNEIDKGYELIQPPLEIPSLTHNIRDDAKNPNSFDEGMKRTLL
jgi:hypothetical protein